MHRLKPLPENSGFKLRNIAIAFVVWIVLIGFGFHYFYGPRAGVVGLGKIEKHELEATFGEGSIGRERERILLDATKKYVDANPDAPAAMAQGKALAPEDFLNEELSRRHAKFRVRDVHGMKAYIYEVS